MPDPNLLFTEFRERWTAALRTSPPSGDGHANGQSSIDWREVAGRPPWDGVPETELLKTFVAAANVPHRDSVEGMEPAGDFMACIPIAYARKFATMGYACESGGVLLGVGSVDGIRQLETTRRAVTADFPANYFIAPSQAILESIDDSYQHRNSQTRETISELESRVAGEIEIGPVAGRLDLLDTTNQSPMIRLVDSILFDAAQSRVSDIHIQPYEDRCLVRFRIDGMLFDQHEVPRQYQEELLSRIKIIGNMNIAEKRLPQDGRASVKIGRRRIDLRIASLPTSFGERIVIRLLDKGARLYSLDDLGMDKEHLRAFDRLIRAEHGLILVTGPTGAGKTTTLYAALQRINAKDRNVLTLEDPIEYQLDGISQTQINPKKGLTFANGLRNVLRQDPDIIMVGEIRDPDTAEMAIQSALTGHLVFSTLHTNDAPTAIARLLDLGVEPYLVASSLRGVMAQRLVRRICANCKAAGPSLHSALGSMKLPADVNSESPSFVGTGCGHCRQIGFRGRLGVFELMEVDDATRDCIQRRATAAEIRNHAALAGMQPLFADGVRKVRRGLTTVDELIRIVSDRSNADDPAMQSQ